MNAETDLMHLQIRKADGDYNETVLMYRRMYTDEQLQEAIGSHQARAKSMQTHIEYVDTLPYTPANERSKQRLGKLKTDFEQIVTDMQAALLL